MSKAKNLISMLREMSDEELKKRVFELKREVFALRALVKREGKTNPARMREAKKEIARILTILRERELQRQKTEKK